MELLGELLTKGQHTLGSQCEAMFKREGELVTEGSHALGPQHEALSKREEIGWSY